MTKRKIYWTAGVVLLVIAGVATWKLTAKKESAFRVVTVERGDLDNKILATGLVQPENRIEIKSPIAGRVEQPLVDEGQKVKKGQILAWMSSTERAVLLDAARARGPEELAHWEDLYKPTPLVAPLPGTIIARDVESGQTITSADVVFVLSDRLIVKVDVDETDIGRIHVGLPVDFTLDAYPDSDLNGKVAKLAQESKTVNNVTTYEVDVLPSQVPAFMKSGMTANVNFVIESRTGILLVPAEAIQRRGRHASVQMADAKQKGPGETRDIKLGLSDNKQTEVLEGLAEGDKILIPKLAKGRSDQKVNPLGMQRPRGAR